MTERLRLRETLAETLRRLPDMARGAGGAIVLSAVLALVVVLAPLDGWGRAAAVLAFALAWLVALGAMTRIGVAEDLAGAKALGLGPFGFQLTKIEARLAGATLLCALFLTIMLALLALVALALFGGAGLDAGAVKARDWAAVGPAWKLGLLGFVGLVVLGAPVVLALRLSLFAPATVGRGQMISLTATSMTNGSMAPLFAGLVVAGLPGLAWLALVAAGGLRGPAALAVGVLALAVIQAPLTAAWLGAAYRRLERPSEDLAPL
ncbi:hypothetical protein BH09PSE1_BH09PSE1_10680 [soil metagenome]